MSKRLGAQTVKFSCPPIIIQTASIVGTKEGEGPLAKDFDKVLEDDKCGAPSWEQAESMLQQNVASLVLDKAQLSANQINYVFSGDLQNQCISAHYGLRSLNIPFFGIYGACSTMTESLSLAAMITDGGFSDYTMCITSSHFCSAEKQFRFPLEYGGQRAPSAQWTVTGTGGAIVAREGTGPCITHVTTGKIVDMGITDINNMGGAMAPAAADTLTAHFNDS